MLESLVAVAIALLTLFPPSSAKAEFGFLAAWGSVFHRVQRVVADHDRHLAGVFGLGQLLIEHAYGATCREDAKRLLGAVGTVQRIVAQAEVVDDDSPPHPGANPGALHRRLSNTY